MKIVLAIDSFKNCLTSIQAENAVQEALRQTGIDAEIVSIPVSDGGEGMLDAFLAVTGGEKIAVSTHNALMRPIQAYYGAIDDTAIIESAQSIGLQLVNPCPRNSFKATTYGVGEILADAIFRGFRKFIVGLGGSATSDAGIGMLWALSAKFGDKDFKGCSFTLASDVKNPLLGDHGAARVFAPQKGATPSQVKRIEERAAKFADMSAKRFGADHSNDPGAGAAGGLGYAFLQYFDAKMESGAELLLRLADFDDIIKDADLVITGEGCADSQTLMGKLPSIVLSHARQFSVPVYLIAGKIKEQQQLKDAGFKKIECITPDGQTQEEAIKPENAIKNITDTIQKLF